MQKLPAPNKLYDGIWGLRFNTIHSLLKVELFVDYLDKNEFSSLCWDRSNI